MTELIFLQIYSCQFANPSHRIYKTFILFYWHIVGGICYCSNSVNNCNSRSENIYVFRISVAKTINYGRSELIFYLILLCMCTLYIFSLFFFSSFFFFFFVCVCFVVCYFWVSFLFFVVVVVVVVFCFVFFVIFQYI